MSAGVALTQLQYAGGLFVVTSSRSWAALATPRRENVWQGCILCTCQDCGMHWAAAAAGQKVNIRGCCFLSALQQTQSEPHRMVARHVAIAIAAICKP